MSVDPWGSGDAPHREKMERASAEIIRRVKLAAGNDPNFVPTFDDASLILASRHYVLPPVVPERASNDANDLLASRVFMHTETATQQGTPLSVPNTLVQRDANGDFAARNVQVVAIVGITVGAYDFVLLDPTGAIQILRVPTGTVNLEALGSLKVATGFGCNSKAPQTAVVAGAAAGAGSGGAGTVAGTAGAAYTATEQGIINALVAQINAQSAILNALAAQVTANATAANTMRTALIADGILS